MHHPRLGLGETKTQRSQCTGDVFAQGHHVVLLAIHEHDKIVRIADLADVAAVLVNGVTAWIALHDMARLDVREDILVLGASGGLGGIAGRITALRPARRVIGRVGRCVLASDQRHGQRVRRGVIRQHSCTDRPPPGCQWRST